MISSPFASVRSCYSWLVALGSDSCLSTCWHRSENQQLFHQNKTVFSSLTFAKGLITLLLGEGWEAWWLAGHPQMLAAY